MSKIRNDESTKQSTNGNWSTLPIFILLLASVAVPDEMRGEQKPRFLLAQAMSSSFGKATNERTKVESTHGSSNMDRWMRAVDDASGDDSQCWLYVVGWRGETSAELLQMVRMCEKSKHGRFHFNLFTSNRALTLPPLLGNNHYVYRKSIR